MTQKSITVGLDAIPPITYTIASVYLVIATMLSWLFNITVFYVMASDKKLWTPVNGVLINLAVADFCISIFGNPPVLICAIAGNWFLGNPMCIAHGFSMGLFGITSIVTLAALAFERYLIICCPFSSISQFTWSSVRITLVCIWMYALTLVVLPLLGWGAYGLEANRISCAINWETRSLNATSYMVFLFTFALIIPLFIIVFSYIQILRTVTRTQRQFKGSTTKKKDTHVAIMILFMITMFFVAWGPYAVASILIALTDIRIAPVFTIFPSLFAKGSCFYNPIVYFLFNPTFRKSLKDILGISKNVAREESPNVKHVPLDPKNPDQQDRNATDTHHLQALVTIHERETRATSISSETPSIETSPESENHPRNYSEANLFPNKTAPPQRKNFIVKNVSLPFGINNYRIQVVNGDNELVCFIANPT